MKITKESLVHTADQARLDLSEEELENYAKDIQAIITFSDKIREINTDGVTPTTIGNLNKNVMRADTPVKWDRRAEALEHAPEHDGAHFKVPAIMD